MALGVHPLRLGYVVLFGLTAVVCFAAVARARARVEDPDTRWGLASLLATSGLWASFHVGRLAAPDPGLKVAFYVLGLLAGLATVGAWLYFCSAYAGESYHRSRFFRWLAVGIYAAVACVKLTSPVHGLYFTTATAASPFPHLVIRLGALHWVVTGLAYALSAVGFYILFDLFQESSHATTRLGVLVGLAGLPVVLDVIGYASGWVVTLNYEPAGVGLFALGVLYVADGSFLAVRRFGREQIVEELDEGIVLLDEEGTVRDANAAAREMFPPLADAVGEPVDEAVPELDAYLPVDGATVVGFGAGDDARYYLLTSPELTVGQTTIGRTLVFSDVTRIERQRREIRRQRDRMDDFAAAITHELRNSVNVVRGHLELAGERLDPDAEATVGESINTAARMTDRMDAIVSDLATLAQYGQSVEGTAPVDVAAVARRAFEAVATDDHRLDVGDAGEIEADEARLERLFEQLFRFAIDNGATRIDLARTGDELVVTDDGRPLDEEDVEAAFAYGQAVPDAESGMVLPMVRTLAEAHGWTAGIDTDYREGVRFVIDCGDGGGG